ncbi:hypothetical protein FRC05_000067 [Tulasnella sp. 425]|nr:hypothetical protein FRC05_000067 [Tulasnella sp. 425]
MSADENVPAVDNQILRVLHANVFLVTPEAFIRHFMYGQEADPNAVDEGTATSLSSSERRARDEDLAAECLQALKGRGQSQKFTQVVQSLAIDETCNVEDIEAGISPYTSNQFTNLVKNINSKRDLYNPLAALLAFIGHFFRCYFIESGEAVHCTVEIDKSWPTAVNPEEKQSGAQTTFLRRRFVATHDKQFRFSRHVQEHPELQPDISLLLYQEPEGNWPKPDELHWKDVKIPIEVKLQDGLDANRVCQMALYAQAVKAEQFDRNSSFGILISKKKCRIFHWDASGCHVTEVDMHDDPAMFIQIVGRLASMDPRHMGYDCRFSNSGRVLANQSRTMTTRLEVIPARPTEFPEQSPRAENGEKPLAVDIYIDRPLFQKPGHLFSRSSRVWEGHEVVGTNSQVGKLRVVKQNWAWDARFNEAFLHEEAKEVPNVARVVGYEGVARTIDTRCIWNDGDVLGMYRVDGHVLELEPLPHLDTASDEEPFPLYPCNESPQVISRVLLRMIFESKGRQICEVHSCRELLEATKQWVTGLWGLNEKGIVHRDVSPGNLLLGLNPEFPAFIIDLGLAQRSAPDSSNTEVHSERIANVDLPMIGTLPFIAYDHFVARSNGESIKHEVHHDLESVFWALLYVVLLEEQCPLAKGSLRTLLSTDVDNIRSKKRAFLTGYLNPMELELAGRFKNLEPFLNGFSRLCWRDRRTLKLDAIVDLIDSSMSSLPPGSGERVVEATESGAGAGAPQSKRRRESVESLEKGVDGTSDAPSGSRFKRARNERELRHQLPE